MDPTLPSPPSLLALFLPINPFLLPSPFSSLAKLSNYSLSSSRPPSFFPPFLPVSCLFNYVSLSVGPAALVWSQILLMEANLATLFTSHHHNCTSLSPSSPFPFSTNITSFAPTVGSATATVGAEASQSAVGLTSHSWQRRP